MSSNCASERRNVVVVDCGDKLNDLTEELYARRFATFLSPIGAKAPLPPLAKNPLSQAREASESNPQSRIFKDASLSNPCTSSASDNATSFTSNLHSAGDKAGGTHHRDDAAHIVQSNPSADCTPVPELAMPQLPSRVPSLPSSTSRRHSPAPTPVSPLSTDEGPRDVRRPQFVFRVPSSDEDNHTCASGGQDRASQQNRRITFQIEAPAEVHASSSTPSSAPPAIRHRNVLAPVIDISLHSEMGTFQLEYLDEGGKLQRRITAYYNHCADQMTPAEEDAEVMFADHLGPFLRESRQFREYVVDDIDRACGVHHTAVTLSADEEEPAHPVGSVTSDGGTDTTTMNGTVVNALKDLEAPGSSELHESYQPLQAAVFESALRRAWEWMQRNHSDATHSLDGTLSNQSLPSAASRGRLFGSLTPNTPSAMLSQASLVTSAGADGSRAAWNANRASDATLSSSSFSHTPLPTFKAEVTAAMQLDQFNDPHAALTPVQLAVCNLCAAELVSRKVIWTSFLAQRYEILLAHKDTQRVSFLTVPTADSSAQGSAVTRAENDRIVQSYFDLTLEEYLPWMADVYLAVYKPVPASKEKLDRQRQMDMAAAKSSLMARKFRSVVHSASVEHCERTPPRCPPAAQMNRLLTDRATTMPSVATFLKSNQTTGVALPVTLTPNILVFTVSFLFRVSFVILEELAIVPRVMLPNTMADAMQLLMPAAASLTRESLLNSVTHSASLAVVSDSLTTAQGHDMNRSDRTAVGDGLHVAVAHVDNASRDFSVLVASPPASAASAAASPAAQALALRHANLAGGLSVELPVFEAAQRPSDAPVPPTTRTRKLSHYEMSRAWLKILFRFFRDEAASNFMNDSPISMRNFFPLPHVSWERMLLRSRAILAWGEFHENARASANSLWGYKDKTRGSRRKGKKAWDQQHWDRALRHCEQEALNLTAAIHEMWCLSSEWFLQYVHNTFKTMKPSEAPRAMYGNPMGGIASQGRGRGLPLMPQPPPVRSPVSRPLCRVDLQFPGSRPPQGEADALQASGLLSIGASASQTPSLQNVLLTPQEHTTSCGSPPSVPSSEFVAGSRDTMGSRRDVDAVVPSPVSPSADGSSAAQKLDADDAPQHLPDSTSTATDSSGFSMSAPSIMSSVSQPGPMHRQKPTIDAASHYPFAMVPPTELIPVQGGDGRQPLTAVLFSAIAGKDGVLAKEAFVRVRTNLDAGTSRLMVPPLSATVGAFYKGAVGDWDLVMLMRAHTLARALWTEQQSMEYKLLTNMRRSSSETRARCAEMESLMRGEEDVWLAHRRHTAKHTWDQVCMEKHMFINRWANERAMVDFTAYAVVSLQSLAELMLDVSARLYEDFHQLIWETRSWAGVPPASKPSQKLATATLALGPSNSISTTDAATVAARKAAEKGKCDDDKRGDPAGGAPAQETKKAFDFWGYGAALPSADSLVGFNDGLVVMSRLCRDMHLRGKRLRTNWFVDKDDEPRDEPVQSFHEISYANHDTYTGFTRVQSSADMESDSEDGLDETHTPLERTDSMTDIHRDGDDAVKTLVRHGLGNYCSTALGYTYVGGWRQDRPDGDGALLYNGVLPWEARYTTPKKSLLLIFGHWEAGRLSHVEVTFSGVPLS